ncbi:hypothetical protein [Paenibacillus bouchesdurhonensis]|uniref:hypothetical protein n=1 Tax=Paenibacillus bouchesdurhonensis TaxID=1870990 RepID=UPI000DA63A84|nr:hypothetical protein [Paenibacillus bouchesdurhonensis]
MGKQQGKKKYRLNFILEEDRSVEIVRNLARSEMKKVFAKHGVVSYNLDDVLSKYITGEMQNDEKG